MGKPTYKVKLQPSSWLRCCNGVKDILVFSSFLSRTNLNPFAQIKKFLPNIYKKKWKMSSNFRLLRQQILQYMFLEISIPTLFWFRINWELMKSITFGSIIIIVCTQSSQITHFALFGAHPKPMSTLTLRNRDTILHNCSIHQHEQSIVGGNFQDVSGSKHTTNDSTTRLKHE